MSARRAALEKLLAGGQDNALLRFSLGQELLEQEPAAAARHLQAAVAFDAGYSAAWKLLGKALVASGEAAAAREAYRTGIEVAGSRGDVQAAREMQVFLKRLGNADGKP